MLDKTAPEALERTESDEGQEVENFLGVDHCPVCKRSPLRLHRPTQRST